MVFNNIKDRYRLLKLLPVFFVILSCEDFLTIPAPSTQLAKQNVFDDDATALAALAGVYVKLADGESFADGYSKSVTLVEALYADELTSLLSVTSSPALNQFYFNDVSPTNEIVASTWQRCYQIIFECNKILEGLNESRKLTLVLKRQLSGEARFIRAFCYFYLANLFGDVPLTTVSDYRENQILPRSPVNLVYEQIIADLLTAKTLLLDEYPSEGRVRVNKGAATALLARAYLFTANFEKAEEQSTELINKSSQYKLAVDLNSVFLKSSEEAIWQLLPKGSEQMYTNEGTLFILLGPPKSWVLKSELLEAFEANDLRKIHWVDSIVSSSGLTTWYYPAKYKESYSNATGAEYSMVLRLAEQYLIRAEARAQQNKLTGVDGAENDINSIRSRAGLPAMTASSIGELLLAIEQERRLEFFTEWGHRFFDLKRTNRLEPVLTIVKPNWNSEDALLPLPQKELLLNANLQPQNPGY